MGERLSPLEKLMLRLAKIAELIRVLRSIKTIRQGHEAAQSIPAEVNAEESDPTARAGE